MKYLFTFIFFTFLAPQIAHASHLDEHQHTASIFSLDGTVLSEFAPFTSDYRGTSSIATADLGTDNVAELIIGAGTGQSPLVHIYRQDGTEIGSFQAYTSTFDRGIHVAACDVDDDGETEVITAPMTGGGPHIRVFSSWGVLKYQFMAYAEDFKGGVHVTCGDVNGDGIHEIITGPGITGGPHVRVFSHLGEQLFESFTGSASENTGLTVAAADLDNDGDDEIITGRAGIGDPVVVVLDVNGSTLHFSSSLLAFDDYRDGIRVFTADFDDDGVSEIGAATQVGIESRLRGFEQTGGEIFSMTAHQKDQHHGILATNIETEHGDRIFTLSTAPQTKLEEGKYIRVDLSDQTLYAYEDGNLVYSALVSSGLNSYPTPQGRTEITDKLLWHDYVWSYGPDNPNNYNLPNVKYNLRFRPHYYLHYAYWHDNFGHQMSHGCVNVGYEDIEWIYHWADVGTIVEVVQ